LNHCRRLSGVVMGLLFAGNKVKELQRIFLLVMKGLLLRH
jgi:hypothetical protein